MIGYYVHHHGGGHAARATAIARELEAPVTGISSLPRPDDWPGEWLQIPLDDGNEQSDPDAHGQLHWVPLGSAGLRERAALISAWIDAAEPRAMVVDVSVEVALLARLHGVPVAVFALPGARGDAAHRLGFEIAAVILAAWPPQATGLVTGLTAAAERRLAPVGAIGRLAPFPDERSAEDPHRVLVLAGRGGDEFSPTALDRARASAPHWTWEHIGGSGTWVDDVRPSLSAASVVITHAGQGALADVAAARKPAVVVPQTRPHDEQLASARVLAAGDWPVIVRDRLPDSGWEKLLERASGLDGTRWERWNDGHGAARAAAVIGELAGREAR